MLESITHHHLQGDGRLHARPQRDNQQFTPTQTYDQFRVDQLVQRSCVQTTERREPSVCTMSLRSIPVREPLVGMDMCRALVAQHQHRAALLNLIVPDGETLSDLTVGWAAVSSGDKKQETRKAKRETLMSVPTQSQRKTARADKETLQQLARA